MRALIIGAGGVGQSVAMLIKRNGNGGADWLEKLVISDYDIDRARTVAEMAGDPRFTAERIDAGSPESIKEVIRKHDIELVLNVVAPNYNECIFDTCLEAGAAYMDCAMTLPQKHPEKPYELPYIKLGDYQFERDEKWKEKGCLALIGSGVEPGIANVFARFAQKHLFDEIDEINVRDGDNYVIPGQEVAFGFSVWTTIEECLNPPLIWEKDRGWYCTESFSEPEEFFFPDGIGTVEVVNVEHEEVVMIPRQIECNRVTFKYGISRDFRTMLKDIEALGMADSKHRVRVGGIEIAPRDFLVKVAPSPLETSLVMEGKGCAGTWVTGKKDGLFRSTYIYQVADNQECVKKYGTSSVVAQTAAGPVIMMELLARGIWKGTGVLTPECFDPDPFIERMEYYGFPAGIHERDSEYNEKLQHMELEDILQ